ncbi:MAG TPA: T9SS type A sorting domain-containing protein [Puia sp.]|nr:T9SS type A sorting domain-containing protein [Puia sp.]
MKTFYLKYPVILIILFCTRSVPCNAQCTAPPGAISITQASFGSVINASLVYYVPTGTIVSIDHSSNDLSIAAGGEILVMANSTLNLNMGGKNMTISGGTVQVCQNGILAINPGHDFTLNSGLISLMNSGALEFCNFGHDITFNAGSIQMDDYSSIELVGYHNLINNVTNLIQYIGSGTVGVGSGDPIFHTGSGSNAMANNLTKSTHIDFVDDNLTGIDFPGSANFCGPQSSPAYATCRTSWPFMGTGCGSANTSQILLPLIIIEFTSIVENGLMQLNWETADETNIKYFVIERSVVPNQFDSIDRVLPQKNADVLHYYSYTDLKKPVENTTYRLKVVEKDGSFLYSKILVVPTANGEVNTISFSPNPFDEYLYMSTNFSNPTIAFLNLYSIAGNLLGKFHLSIGGGQKLTRITNLAFLPAGLYIVEIVTPDHNYYQRLIKR